MKPAGAVAAVLADMQELRRAFATSGLLDVQPPASAVALAGGAAQAERLRRDLLLADALLRNRVARRRGGLRHVVVFGGTKVGKSSVVNILAKAPLAPVSPEGGFTRWPWAFTAAADPLDGLPLAFPGFARVAPGSALRDRFDQYCVATRATDALPRDVVLWDTPDCDSVGAERYLAGLVEALSLADLVVYVTSVEKYAVAALVDWVFALHAAGVPLLECLNKTPRRDREPVLRKQAEEIFPRMAREHGMVSPTLPVVALRFMMEGEEADLWNAALHPEADELRAAVLRHATAADAQAARRAAAEDAARRIAGVLRVAQDAQAARAAWEQATREAIAGFLHRYEAQYLGSGEVIEPFMRLNIEIMRLLDYDNRELNAALQFVRRWTTLPARIVVHVGRHIYSTLANRNAPEGATDMAPQAQAFANAHADLLNTLGRLIDKERRATAHHPFWDQLAAAWEAALPDLHAAFGARIATQLRNTDSEIRAAAASIVAELRKRPALLNALKGARIATQAGAVAAGFLLPHGGGLVHDLLEELVITPLLLGATEKSADWLVGAFVERRRRELIARLKQDAATLAETTYRMPLRALADAAKTFDVDSEVLDRLPGHLRELQRALESAAA
jgi:hypothetical protein